DKCYGIEQEQRPLEGVVKKRVDFTIRYVKNGTPKKVVLMENKKRGYETHASVWADAVTQLTNYIKLVHVEQLDNNILYAAVCVGTYVRFYYHERRDEELTDYPTLRTGDYYELKNDEEEVHRVLTELVAKTNH
ncbi:hypothetical protein FQN49_008044, partial [Arthroderma sp. PD_2]